MGSESFLVKTRRQARRARGRKQVKRVKLVAKRMKKRRSTRAKTAPRSSTGRPKRQLVGWYFRAKKVRRRR